MAVKDPQIAFNYAIVRQQSGEFLIGSRMVAGNVTAAKLEVGEQVTTSSIVTTNASVAVLGSVFFDNGLSMWLPSGNTGFTRKYLGFKMRATAADAWKFGWLELTYSIAVNGRQTVTFHSAAYDTSGFPLAMGATTSSAPVPANDAFANAAVLSGTNLTLTASSANASKEAGEPSHAGNFGGGSLWWRWTPTAGANARIDTFGSAFDTTLAVYVATNSPPMVTNLLLLTANDDTASTLASRVDFVALAGLTYYIAVDGYNGQTGELSLNLASTNIAPPAITRSPTNAVVMPGTAATFSAEASSGSPGLALQWQRSTDAGATWQWLSAADGVTGATSTNLVVINVITAMSGHRFRLMASNYGGPVYSAAATLTISVPPPAVTSPTSATATVGVPFTYMITTTGNVTGFSVGSAPAWLTLNATNGVLSGVPTASGTHFFAVNASGAGGAGGIILTLLVNPAPAPVITSPTTASATVGSPFSFQVVANNGAASFVATGLPSGFVLNANSGQISGTPTSAGTHTINLAATGPGGTGFGSFTLTIQAAPNQPPTITAISVAGLRQAPASLTVSVDASDPDGTTPSVQLSTNSTVFSTLSARPFVFTVPGLAAGSHSLSVQAIDGQGARSTILTTNVTVTNAPAQVSTVSLGFSLPTAVLVGSEFAVPVQLISTNAVVNALSTSISWDAMKLSFVGASNNEAGASLNVNTNQLPSGRVGVLLGLPAGASIASGTQSVVTLTFRAMQSATGSTLLSFESTPVSTSVLDALANPITANLAPASSVVLVGVPPVIVAPGAWTAFANQPFTNQISLASNNATAFGATGLPAGIAIDPVTGRVTGTPTVTGNFALTLTASNAAGTSSASVVLTVYPTPPFITSPTSVTGMVGQSLTYQTIASNSPTNYMAFGLPTGLSMLATNGRVSGVPTTAGTYPVTITAYNSPLGFDGRVVTFTIASPAPAPVITSPASLTGTNGSPFSHVLSATGSPTGFGLSGSLPSGLTFNGGAGTITGTPTVSGSFTFTLTATNASGSDSKTVTLTILPPPNQPPTISLTSISGSFTAPAALTVSAVANDVDGPNPSVQFQTNGVLAATLTAPPYTITLSGLGAGAFSLGIRATDNQGAQSALVTTNVVVTNPPPAGGIQFSAGSYMANENAGSAVLSIVRLGGSWGTVTVECGTSDGSARAGSDFVGLTNTLSWANGDASPKPFTVNLINDTIVESGETFTVRLFNPGAGTSLGNPATATVTIVDDDVANQPPAVSLSISENRTAPANVSAIATASDADGQVVRVEWLLNGVKQGETAVPPFTFTFANLLAGEHQLAARAVDNQGAATVAGSLVTITNQPAPPGGLSFAVGEVAGATGESVLVPVKAYGFRDIAGVQFSVGFSNLAVGTFEGVEQFGLPSLAGANFGTNTASSGVVTFSWESLDPNGSSLPDGATLFALRYRLAGSPGTGSTITINGSPTPVEVVDSQLRLLTPTLSAGRLAVLQNVTLSGRVTYHTNGAPLAGVEVRLNGGSNALATTDSNGGYSFTVPAGGNYVVTAQRTNDASPTLGLTTADILLLRRHILSISPLEGFSLLAADLDGNGVTTTLDILHLRRLILGLTNSVPSSPWRFASATGATSNAFTNLTSNVTASFLAVKVGDVNGSWSAPLAPQALPRRAAALGTAVQFRVAQVSLTPGHLVVAVSADGFSDCTTAQFSVLADAQTLRLEGISGFALPGLGQGNFGTNHSGSVAISWDSPSGTGVTLADGTALFTLSFAVLPGTDTGSTLIGFGDVPVPREVTSASGLVAAEFLPATISLAPAPGLLVIQHPQGGLATSGGTMILSVRTSSADAASTIEWQRDGQSLGVSGADLVLSNLTRATSGAYRAVIRSGSQTVMSSNAVVRVMVPQRVAPPQLLSGNRIRLTFADADGTANVAALDPGAFQLQVCTNLASGVWTTLTNSVSSSNGQWFVEDVLSPADGLRLYRIIER
ncbi:MAG: putative Ig domain-containing protein [Limisphaerales bacterium]